MFKVRVKVSNFLDPELFFEEDFWIDTGAIFSSIPEDRLKSIDITPMQMREILLSDGRRDLRRLGSAHFTLKEPNETLPTLVLFGPKGSSYVLGALALESFCLEADPIERKLKPIAAIMGGSLATK